MRPVTLDEGLHLRFQTSCAAAFALLCVASPAVAASSPAENTPAGPSLVLADAMDRTIARNPDLAHFAFERRAREARITQAGLGPPLSVGAQLENFAGTGDLGGLSSAETTLTLSGVIELGDQRNLRIAAARLGAEGLEVERQSAQLDVLAEVARRFIHVAADQEQLELTRLATRLAEQTAEEIDRRVRAARSPAVEAMRAQVTLSRARLEEEHAEHELLSSRRLLAAMWGDREADFGPVVADLYALPEIHDFELLAMRLAASPDFLAFASEARQREAQVQLELGRARSAITWNVGVRRLERDDDIGLVAGFSMPLYGRRRAEAAVAETRSLREGVEARETAARVRAEATLYGLVQELRHAVTEAAMLRDEITPLMDEALEATEYAWRRGRYSYLEWTEAQRERLAVQRALIESAVNAQVYQVEIERLTRSAIPGEAQ